MRCRVSSVVEWGVKWEECLNSEPTACMNQFARCILCSLVFKTCPTLTGDDPWHCLSGHTYAHIHMKVYIDLHTSLYIYIYIYVYIYIYNIHIYTHAQKQLTTLEKQHAWKPLLTTDVFDPKVHTHIYAHM